MTRAQQRACETLLPVYGFPYSPDLIDLDTVFGRHAPTVLEIGFGMGETTAQIAAQYPEKNFLGIEVHAPGVGSLLNQIADQRLENVRVIQHDVVEVVHNMIAPGGLHAIHIFFPDPWPKKRHHKRRLLQPAFVHELALRLETGGYIHIATDWQDYAEQILDVFSQELLLENTTVGYAPRPTYRPQTKFEARGVKLGHEVRDVIFRRR